MAAALHAMHTQLVSLASYSVIDVRLCVTILTLRRYMQYEIARRGEGSN